VQTFLSVFTVLQAIIIVFFTIAGKKEVYAHKGHQTVSISKGTGMAEPGAC
jgi:hypothetical protein